MLSVVRTVKPHGTSPKRLVKSLADALIEIGAFDDYELAKRRAYAIRKAQAIIALTPRSDAC